jgi:small subunit ribosomal protein S21
VVKDEGVLWMAEVIVKENERFEDALRRFKRMCEKEGILSEIKKHQEYEKPSEKKKRRIIQAKRRVFRRQKISLR